MAKSKKIKLKPCPFCGKEGFIFKAESFDDEMVYYPRCRTENCIGNNGWVNFETGGDAAEAWNRRANGKE